MKKYRVVLKDHSLCNRPNVHQRGPQLSGKLCISPPPQKSGPPAEGRRENSVQPITSMGGGGGGGENTTEERSRSKDSWSI